MAKQPPLTTADFLESEPKSRVARAPKKQKGSEGAKRMRVVAVRLGFYNNVRVRPGETFELVLEPEAKMPSWVRLESEVESEETSQESQTATSQSSSDDVI